MVRQRILKGLYSLLLGIARGVVSLRYHVEVKGLEQLTPERLNRGGGILFLPNHPAEMDPVILTTILGRKFRPRPLVVEHFYYLVGFGFFIRLAGALPLPNMQNSANRWKQKQMQKQFDAIRSELNKGEQFLIYPAGRLKLEQREVLGGASFIHNLLQECPKVNVVMIRTTGLWGSRFSRALTGSVPEFGKMLLEGMKIVLKNGIFFAPRRKVTIEIAVAPCEFPYQGSRLEVNQYLEEWYNRVPDPLTLVSDCFWKQSFPEIKVKEKKEMALVEVPQKVRKEICAQVAALARQPVEAIKDEVHLARDLGLDSLDIAELHAFLDRNYDVGEVQPSSVQTVQDLLQAAVGARKEEAKVEKRKGVTSFPEEPSRPPIRPPQGATLQEAFLRSCDRMGKHAVCADALTGVISYARMKKAALALAEHFKKLPGDYLGVMLPSSTAAYTTVLACLLAKKIPVMLNWTIGARALDHAAAVTGLQVVLTSRRFLDRLDVVELGTLEDRLLLLEDVRARLSLKEKLRGFYLSTKSCDSLVKTVGLAAIKQSDPTVVLFTSGTEALPKGVPLSHENLLSNQSAAISSVAFTTKDLMYCVLPPFHSFGFSVTGLLPILTGLKAYYAPNPTDSHGMASDIAHWRPTLFCCAPSFVRMLFSVAAPEQLLSVKLFVTGAEKTPSELFEAVAKLGPGHELIEGYGITECSPIVTLNLPGKPLSGVGRPLPGIELMIIDLETRQRLPQGQEGEICIAGCSVFSGYLGSDRSPFLFLDGKRWYCSGDRGYLTEDGALILSGRLKRFVKIGGEMVSLGGLEEELQRLSQEKGWGPPVQDVPTLAITARERESEKPSIVLSCTFDLTKEQVNAALEEHGYGRLIKIAEVRKLDQIPVLGTGKTNYRALEEG